MTQPAFAIYSPLHHRPLPQHPRPLWGYSGAVRTKTKTTHNPEDLEAFDKAAAGKVVTADPPEVAHVLRAHTNAVVNILPFLLLDGLLYVVNGASARGERGSSSEGSRWPDSAIRLSTFAASSRGARSSSSSAACSRWD